jgi:hypothetical protein
MSFIKLNQPQIGFLEQHLRGTGRTMTARQAEATYGIRNLRARMTEMRNAGLKVNTEVNTMGLTAYSVSARDVTGSRAAKFI